MIIANLTLSVVTVRLSKFSVSLGLFWAEISQCCEDLEDLRLHDLRVLLAKQYVQPV